jgi:hypothetical protein
MFLGNSPKVRHATRRILRKKERLERMIGELSNERRLLVLDNGASNRRLTRVQKLLRRKAGHVLTLKQQYFHEIDCHPPPVPRPVLLLPQSYATTATPLTLLKDECMGPAELNRTRQDLRWERRRQVPAPSMPETDLPPTPQNQVRESRQELYVEEIMRAIRAQLREQDVIAQENCDRADALLDKLGYDERVDRPTKEFVFRFGSYDPIDTIQDKDEQKAAIRMSILYGEHPDCA